MVVDAQMHHPMPVQDNNPFSETFQVREQIMKMQQTGGTLPPISPSDTPTPSPGPSTPNPVVHAGGVRPGKLSFFNKLLLRKMSGSVLVNMDLTVYAYVHQMYY